MFGIFLERFLSYQDRRIRSNYLFCRIFQRKAVSHFCWKCSTARRDDRAASAPAEHVRAAP
ncbi:hypothetical protein C3731_03530 [Brucella oryzae]|uniref:Uncharacterized protein n=1 Tax=Brucella oryzae TaxID=335286 RepID=A0A2S7J421_9HYPH|nr:hypothetical protein C3731_03530 [Brucella oryzae]